MREISVDLITQTVAKLCVSANMELPDDLCAALAKAEVEETSETGKNVLAVLQNNLKAAKEQDIPICQDTGMAVVFLELGQEVAVTGGDLYEAIHEGVREGYLNGYLRCSVVRDPLRRVNTGDNTPAIIHTDIVPGDEMKITVAPKGFGSENMSAVYMLTPAADENTVVEKVLQTVKQAGSNPCPPVVVGVGIGGNFEEVTLLAKRALCRSTAKKNKDSFYAELEERMLNEINKLGIGPQGFGGKTTALAVNIEWAPTHIAGLPLAINMGCHVTRHATKVI